MTKIKQALRRTPAAQVSQERPYRFRIFKEMSNFYVQMASQNLTILNVSTTGLAVEGSIIKSEPGAVEALTFHINGEDFLLNAKIIRQNENLTAFSYENPTDDFVAAFLRFLDVERKSVALSAVDSNLIKQDTHKGDVSWYRGGKGDELFYSHSPGVIHYLLAQVVDHILEYSDESGARVGSQRVSPPWFVAQSDIQEAKKIFGRYFENIEGLSGEHRTLLNNILSRLKT